jgi:hypothetical protein
MRGHFGAIRNLRFGDDPLLRNIFDYLGARDADTQRRAIDTAIDMGEPRVIASIVAPALEARLAPAFKEDGAALASMLIACRLGADCGPESVTMLGLCAQRGWCADSIDAALREGLGADYAVLDQLSAQALVDIRKHNTGALLHAR